MPTTMPPTNNNNTFDVLDLDFGNCLLNINMFDESHVDYEASDFPHVIPPSVHESCAIDQQTFLEMATTTTTIAATTIRKTHHNRVKLGVVQKIGFKIMSEVDVLDDGYNWRKYGKKVIKNSPYPRNYYKCYHVGCLVKKIVERDCEDPSYVLTIYNGVHNHSIPVPGSVCLHTPPDDGNNSMPSSSGSYVDPHFWNTI